jgi:hypothetical protein
VTEPVQRNETIRISSDGVYRGATIHIPFPLESSDFLKLTKVNSLLPIWAHAFFTGTIVFIITVFAKWADRKYFSGVEDVSGTELLTLAILVVFAVILEVLYLFLPSEKKRMVSKIESHFKVNTPIAAGFNNE